MARKTGRIIKVDHFLALDNSGESVAEFSVEQCSDTKKWLVFDLSGSAAGSVVARFEERKDAIARAKAEATRFVVVE